MYRYTLKCDDIVINDYFPNITISLKVAKSIVVGDSAVGKTCLVNRCVTCSWLQFNFLVKVAYYGNHFDGLYQPNF